MYFWIARAFRLIRATMPRILITYPIDYSSVILADKLKVDIDNEVHLFIDPEMTNVFSTNVVHDLQSMSSSKVEYTSSKVIYSYKWANINKMFRTGEHMTMSSSVTWMCFQAKMTRPTLTPSKVSSGIPT